MATSRTTPPPWLRALLVAAGIVALQALLVPLFAGVASNAEPRDLPVVVAGPESAAGQLADRLEAERPGAFEITRVPDQAAAERALRDREAYAAFVLAPGGQTVLTASAASPAVAQLFTRAAAELDPGGAPVPVRDVVPADPDDPRGAGFSAGFLPLVLTSMLAGIALVFVVRGRWARLLGLAGYAVLAGLAGAAVLQGWLGVVSGDYLTNAAAIALITLAAAAGVAGLGAALGPAGVGLGAILVFLVGNPLSGVAAAPELLPQPWGAIGQWLPAGAGGTLLRSVSWFDGAGAGMALTALAAWVVVGTLLVLVGRASLLPPGQRSGGGGQAVSRATD